MKDWGFSWITALVLTYSWIKYHSDVLSVTDLPQIQRWHQPYAAENRIISVITYLVTFGLVLGINVKLSSSSFQSYLRENEC